MRGISQTHRSLSELSVNVSMRLYYFAVITTTIAMTSALRIVMLDIPSPSMAGESVELMCSYDLENDRLYSIKWYKNGYEFYRFVPRDWPQAQYLAMPGIKVDLSRSDKMSVYLQNVNLSTSGKYRCEISAEAPSFNTAAAEDYLVINVLPSEGPRITGDSKSSVSPGDIISVNCTSPKSKPKASLNFTINDEPIGSEHDLEHSTTLYADGLESTSVSLRFKAKEKHFVPSGHMTIKCRSHILGVYRIENEAQLIFRNQINKPELSTGMSEKSFQQVSSEAKDIHNSDSPPKEWKVLSVLFAMYLHRQLQRMFAT